MSLIRWPVPPAPVAGPHPPVSRMKTKGSGTKNWIERKPEPLPAAEHAGSWAVFGGMSLKPVPYPVLAAPVPPGSAAAEVHTSWNDFWAAAKLLPHRTAAHPRGLCMPTQVFDGISHLPFAGQPALVPTANAPPELVRSNRGVPVPACPVAPVAPIYVQQPAAIPPGMWRTGAVSCGMSHMHFAAPPALDSAPSAPPGSLPPNDKVHVPPQPWAPFAKVSVLQTAAIPPGMWWYVTYVIPF